MGAILLNGVAHRRGLDRRGRHAARRGHEGAAAVAGDGQPGQGEAAADRRRGRRRSRLYADRYVGYRLDYMKYACPTDSPPARARHARLPAGRRPPPRVRHRRRRATCTSATASSRSRRRRSRTSRRCSGKYGEEGNKLIFKILQARRARGQRRGRPGAALRPDGAARARRRAVSERAAEVLQALSDSAGVARRPPGARALPRVLSVRHRRDRLDVAGRRGGAAARRSATC